MATTQADLQQQGEEYSAVFAEPEQEKPEMNEDEAFGLLPEPAEDGTSTPGDDEASEEAPVVSITAEEPAEEAAEEPVVEKPAMTKDQQREASWEGRLRAREAELKAREDALRAMEAELQQAKPAEAPTEDGGEEAAGSPGKAAQLSEVVKQVEDGDMTADAAMAQLRDDFGPEFAKAVSVLINKAAMDTAAKIADERIGPVNKSIEDLISGITDKSARDHFEAIADAHPDFQELADSDSMKQYLASLPEDEQAKANNVIENGSARSIIKLLNKVKEFSAVKPEPAPDPEVAAAMDAAEGVRSKGLRIPEKPAAASDSYEDAWNSLPD